MNHSIPLTSEEILALKEERINEETVAAAIAGVVQIAKNQGQSLEDLTKEVLAEDSILDQVQRRWLSKIVIEAWECLS